ADLVRGKEVQRALDELRLTNKKGAVLIHQLVKSAVANASNRATIDVDRLKISEIMVDMGPVLKRFLPRAQGRATSVKKRMSHISLKVKES
ncbi:MAG: 50S ribosomal protein L22, partial [Proteobacteria bacterium]|nr:50S ribosomal protein L22 [Pseudomonadota bacterium]